MSMSIFLGQYGLEIILVVGHDPGLKFELSYNRSDHLATSSLPKQGIKPEPPFPSPSPSPSSFATV